MIRGKATDKDFFVDYHLYLISPGGAGCSHIHSLLDRNGGLIKNDVDDRDNLKHLSSPDQSSYQCNNFRSVVYLYNDPLSAIVSHYRRGWQLMQHKKVIDKPEDLMISEVSNLQSLQETVLKLKRDVFGVEKHFYNWIKLVERNNFAVVDFRDTTDVKDVFGQLLNMSIDYTIRERSSESKRIIDTLDKEFVDYYTQVDMTIREEIKNLKSKRKLTRVL
jgi:hypothetical protein